MNNVSMHFAGKLKTLNGQDRNFVRKWVERFLEKHEKFVSDGILNMQLEQRRGRFREVPLFRCKVNFFTNRGKFVASGEEYGIRQSVGRALDKVKRQLLKQKKR